MTTITNTQVGDHSKRKTKYEDRLNEYISATDGKITSLISAANDSLAKLKTATEGIVAVAAKAKEDGTAIEVAKEEITSYRQELLEGDEDTESIKDEVEDFRKYTDDVYSRITSLEKSLFGATREELIEIPAAQVAGMDPSKYMEKNSKFYEKKTVEVPGIEQRIKEFDAQIAATSSEFAKRTAQEIKSFTEAASALVNEMKLRLPEMTAAGLSAAFEKNRKYHEEKEKKLLWIFYAVILVMVVIPFGYGYVFKAELNFKDTSDFFLYFLRMAPFEFPLVWLAWFLSRRIKQEARLHEEYQHKWAVAYSYEGLRQEANDLDADSEDKIHLSEVFTSFVESYSLNPSPVISASDENMPYEKTLKYLTGTLKKEDKKGGA